MRKWSLGIIADDLTGALDTGVQFSKWGLESLVALVDPQPEAPCVVINTNSRALPRDAAAEQVRRAVRLLRGRLVYKKIDSTLRGNIGSELWAAIEELQIPKAVIAPAFPANGRTTEAGRVFVRGVPLEHTGFARDPRNAISESHVPTLLRSELGEEVASLGLNVVEQGWHVLHEAIASSSQRIVVVDAATQEHLTSIGRAVVQAGGRWLPVGSAGLAEALPPALGLHKSNDRLAHSARADGPVLVLAGSRNDVCAAQLREAIAVLDWPVIEPETQRLVEAAEREGEIARVAAAAGRLLSQGRSGIVTTCFAGVIAGASESIAEAMGLIALRVAEGHRLGGLFLTGGDIAFQVCRALSAKALHPIDEVVPGLPASELRGGKWDGLRIVTKAGGFGERNAIVLGCHYLTGDE